MIGFGRAPVGNGRPDGRANGTNSPLGYEGHAPPARVRTGPTEVVSYVTGSISTGVWRGPRLSKYTCVSVSYRP